MARKKTARKKAVERVRKTKTAFDRLSSSPAFSWKVTAAILSLLVIAMLFGSGYGATLDSTISSLQSLESKMNTTEAQALISQAISILEQAKSIEESAQAEGEAAPSSSGPFELVVLNSANCTACSTDRLVAVTKSIFLNASVRYLDVDTDEGAQLVEDYSITVLPAYIFDEELAEDPAFPAQRQAFEKRGSKYMLRQEITGASYYVSEEARAAAEAAAAAAQQEKCGALTKADKPKATVYIMSICPYGTQFVNGMLPVQELLGSEADLEVMYTPIVLHGDAEVLENKRQACIREEQSSIFWSYMKCYVETGDGNSCESSTGADSDALAACVATNGTSYLNADAAELKNVYGMDTTGSPTFFVNGEQVSEYDFSDNGRSPENLKTILCCSFNDQPDECSTRLSTANPPRGFGVIGTSSAASSAGSC